MCIRDRSNRNLLAGTHDVLCGECKCLTVVKPFLALFKIFNPDFRSLGVQQNRRRTAKTVSDASEGLDGFPVLFVGTVGKVDTRYIHACFQHFLQGLPVPGRRTDGADDFRFSHCYHPVSYTHLDVYKRQALLFLPQGRPPVRPL